MIINEILTPQLSLEELDKVLANCCEALLDAQAQDSEQFGMVAACVVTPDGDKIYGVNYAREDGTRVHAERAALDRCTNITPDCIIVTTLSPCNRPMSDRHGESCEDLIKESGITQVYCGYRDPTQDQDTAIETKNPKLRELCQKFADTFLNKQELDEIYNLAANDYTGRNTLTQKPIVDKATLAGYQPLPGGSNFAYKITEKYGRQIDLIDSTNGRQAGILRLLPYKQMPEPNCWQVEVIAVSPDYRGQGVATGLYGIVFTVMGATLVAGSDQTPGGKQNWTSMSQIPGVEIQGYVAISDAQLDSNHVTGELFKSIMDVGAEYWGDPPNAKSHFNQQRIHFFTFPVGIGDKGSLESIIKSKIKVYHGYHEELRWTTGLIARWHGNKDPALGTV